MTYMKGVVGSAALAILIAGCAGGESPGLMGPTSPSPVASPSPNVDEEAIAQAEADAAECEAEMGDFLDALQALDSRLSVGLTQDDYNRELGDIRVVYDQIPFAPLSQSCILKVGIPSENSFNAYARANNIWSRCIQNFQCDIDSIDPQLQRNWRQASRLIRKAENGKEGLAVPT